MEFRFQNSSVSQFLRICEFKKITFLQCNMHIWVSWRTRTLCDWNIGQVFTLKYTVETRNELLFLELIVLNNYRYYIGIVSELFSNLSKTLKETCLQRSPVEMILNMVISGLPHAVLLRIDSNTIQSKAVVEKTATDNTLNCISSTYFYDHNTRTDWQMEMLNI